MFSVFPLISEISPLKGEVITEQYSRQGSMNDLSGMSIVVGSLDLNFLNIHPIIFLADAVFAHLTLGRLRSLFPDPLHVILSSLNTEQYFQEVKSPVAQ